MSQEDTQAPPPSLECAESIDIDDVIQEAEASRQAILNDEESGTIYIGSDDEKSDGGNDVAVGEKRNRKEKPTIDGLVVQKKKRLCNARKLCVTIAKCGEPLESVKDAFVEKIKVNFEYKFVHETHEDGDLHVHGAIKAKECIQLYDNALVINGNRYGIHLSDMSRTPWDMLTSYLMNK